MNEQLRKTGLEVIGNVPWGTHICQFYHTEQDLIDILVPYFSEGLKNNEFCLWVTAEPLGVGAARKALAAALPNFENCLNRGQIEIIPHTDWYLKDGSFDAERVLKDWVRKHEEALAAGHEGLRLSGNTFWLEQKNWKAFTEYEAAADAVIGQYRMLAICTYSLDRCGIDEILDVIGNHGSALVRRRGRWELIESSEGKRARQALRESGEKYRRLFQNMAEGFALYELIVDEAGEPVDWQVLEVNDAYAQHTGIPPGQIAKRRGSTFSPEAVKEYLPRFARVVATQSSEEWETFAKTVGRQLRIFTFPMGGRCFASTIQDISGRKAADEELRKAKDKLEIKIKERTAELEQINERLKEENQERMRTERLLRLEEARLDALLHLSQISEASLNKITGFTLEQAIALTRSKIGFLGLLSEDESVYTLHAVSKDVVKECDVTGDPMQWHVIDAGIWANAIREHRTLFINDYSQPLPNKKGLPPGHPYIRKFMVVPVFEGERIVAVAGVANKVSDYDKSDERQIVLLLLGMWGYVQKNRSREALQKAYTELEVKVEQRTAELAASTMALQESQNDLKRAQEVGQIGSWRLDIRSNVLLWSDENYRIFGVPIGTPLTYETFLETVYPEDREYVDTMWKAGLRGEPYDIEHRMVAGGEVKWLREKAYLEFDDAGKLLGGFGITQDITERKKTEALHQALAEQDRLRLGVAVEQASDAVVMVDLDGTIKYVNAAFESISRLSRDKAVGSSYFDLLADEPSAAAIRESIAQGRAWHGHLTRPVSDERPVDLNVAISPARDPSGTVIGVLINEKDVTQANALQRHVRHAQKMEALGTLAGGITHDFNNILSTITINTELALLDIDPSNPGRKPLPLVLQAANRGKELVKQIITFTRQKERELKPVEIAAIVKEGMKFLRSTMPKNIEIHETIHNGSGIVLADPSQIHQILVNLCQNAALAMGDCGGHIEVKLELIEADRTMAARLPDLKPGPYVRLTVSDTGCGISNELLERIFEPFFTTREPGMGSGLGLAVVHGIVKSYDGAISVYSEQGQGSVFSVYIPRLEEQATVTETAKPLQIQKGQEHILFVEDEDVQLKSMTQLLKRLGYRATAKSNGLEALRAFKKNPDAFDLVITDQTMPRMTGIELARALVKIRPDIPIILCTGFSEKIDGEAIGREGIRAYLMKPFTLQEISKQIRLAFKK